MTELAAQSDLIEFTTPEVHKGPPAGEVYRDL